MNKVATRPHPKDLRNAAAPIDIAFSLPPAVYTSQQWYDREVEQLFMHGWLVAAREEELPNPGDYLRVDFFGEPLVVIRGRDATIRTLSATCRHRGSELLKGRGRCKAIVCPYHSWTYSLAGDLIGTPGMGEARDFHKEDYSLPKVRTETWGGFVFVNFDPNAESLLASLNNLPDRFAAYKLDEMVVTRKWELDVAANWKVWVENSREGYHLGTVHRPSLEKYSPGYKLIPYTNAGVPGVYCMTTCNNEMGMMIPDNPLIPFIDGLTSADLDANHYVVMYPHFIFNLAPDRMALHQLFPLGPNRTKVVYWLCFPRSTTESARFAEVSAEIYEPFDSFIPEDHQICEAVQRGLQSRFAAPGRLSPGEEVTVHSFAEYLVGKMGNIPIEGA